MFSFAARPELAVVDSPLAPTEEAGVTTDILRRDHSVGATNARHRFVLSGSYELPVGRGNQLGSHLNGISDAIAGSGN
jgi:hypothetical protein